MARETLIAIFDNATGAEQALTDLRESGFREDQLGVLTRANLDPVAGNDLAGDTLDPSPDGAWAGALTGGTLGGLLGAGAALLIPGIGPIVAGGIVAATIGGAAAGAAAGTLIGSMLEIDMTEDEADYYQGELQAGRVLTIVRLDDPVQFDEVTDLLHRHGGVLTGEIDPADRPAPVATPGDAPPPDLPVTGPIATPPIVTEPRVVAPSVLPPLSEDEGRRTDHGQV